MAQYIFGAGVAWATPLTDAYGNTVTNGTPLQLCVAQEITQEDSFETKKLYGQNQFPVDAGRGKGSLSVKAKFAQVNGLTVSSLYYGQTLSTGLDGRVFDVAFRGDVARRRDSAGGGLGLTIAKGLVEAQDGCIDVSNRPGGCCFTVRLPLATGEGR